MTEMQGLPALLSTPKGRDLLLSHGIHTDPGAFRAALAPVEDDRLQRASGGTRAAFIHMHQQVYLDQRPSVLCKVFALDALAAQGDLVDSAFLWIDTDRAASDKLACRFYWPFDGAMRTMKITPPDSEHLETRFARIDPPRTEAAYDRIAGYLRRENAAAAAEIRLESLRPHMVAQGDMSLRDYGMGLTRALFSAHLHIHRTHVTLSDVLDARWLTRAIEDVLAALPSLIAAYNAQVQTLQSQGIGTAVGPLPPDYLPLYVSDPDDGARLRLRHVVDGGDHFAVAVGRTGRTHRFFLGTRHLRLDELAATRRWSPDVTLPMLANALFSGWVAGKSSALYAMVFHKVLTDVLGKRPIPILVPVPESDEPGRVYASSLLHAHVTGAPLSGHHRRTMRQKVDA